MSGEGWLDAFLEMMAVERSAAKNTLAAYSRDLADAQLFLKGLGSDLAKASAEQIEAYFEALGERGGLPGDRVPPSLGPSAILPVRLGRGLARR